ncbi:MAG: hypothetical protein JXR48_10040 [Candidatus Delongbacteria bacterium]|nr:hypothetical protein [Candidatus Delongbacteria bacterium]
MPTKDVIYDISSMREFAKQLLGCNKEYEEFLKYILEKDYYYDEDLQLPTIKQLEQETGLKYTTIRKYVQSIYRDLHDSDNLDFFIYQTEYTFYMRYFDKRASVTLKRLPVIPRVGEQIDIPFFRTKVGTTSFFMDEIYHHLSEKKQEITFYLKPGRFNHYWKIRKDEAILKGEINRDEYWDHMDFDAKEKLHLRNW